MPKVDTKATTPPASFRVDDNDTLILALAAEYRGIWAAAAHFDRETLRLREIDESLCRGFGHQRDALQKRSHVILGGICALAATGLAAAAVQSEAASILAEAATSERHSQ